MRKEVGAFLGVVLLLSVLPTVARAQDSDAATLGPRITGLTSVPSAQGTEVRIEVQDGIANYQAYREEPTVLVVEIFGAQDSNLPEKTFVGADDVQSILVEQNAGSAAGNITRFRFFLAPNTTHQIALTETGLKINFAPPVPALGDQHGADGSAGTTVEPVEPAEAVEQPVPVETQWDSASRLLQVSTFQGADGCAAAVIADGAPDFRDFQLHDPERLVLDFYDVENGVAERTIPVSNDLLERIRVGQFQVEPRKIARVVFDLVGQPDYHINRDGTRVNVVFGTLSDEESRAASAPGGSPAPLRLAARPPGTLRSERGGDILKYAGNLREELPGGFSQQGIFVERAPVPQVSDTMVQAEQPGTPGYEAMVVAPSEAQYTGEPITLDLKDADIKDVFRFFHELTGLNIILDPDVSGKVTLTLTAVPWDQALDIILRNAGLGKTLEGNVLRIATNAKLAQEEQDRRRLMEEQELSMPVKTIIRRVSYAKAQEVQALLNQVISKRGSILVDQRTNTLVIKEISSPGRLQVLTELISTLDTPTPQVEIEARIVETTKNFLNSVGVQWGFTGIADAETGNTTSLSFPNNYRLNGDLIVGGGITSSLPNNGWAVNLPASGGTSGAMGFSFGNIADTFQLDLVLSAIETEGRGKVISAPRVTTQNNFAALIESGSQVPYQTIANNTITTTFISASLRLNVTPQITAEGTIILDITVEQNSPDFSRALPGQTGNVPISTRRAQTQVLVKDGGTTVIGGVFQVSVQGNRARVPLFHKIPVLGWLFKNRFEQVDNDELMIFITPKIKKLQMT
jgi:type IV pilus secretin PilQ/predicted competence protein